MYRFAPLIEVKAFSLFVSKILVKLNAIPNKLNFIGSYCRESLMTSSESDFRIVIYGALHR